MDQIEFSVKGSAETPYRVTFIKLRDQLSAQCTCAAGVKGQACKHRQRILDGLDTGIVSTNAHLVATVLVWLSGTALETARSELLEAERKFDQAQRALTSAKKQMMSAMHGKS